MPKKNTYPPIKNESLLLIFFLCVPILYMCLPPADDNGNVKFQPLYKSCHVNRIPSHLLLSYRNISVVSGSGGQPSLWIRRLSWLPHHHRYDTTQMHHSTTTTTHIHMPQRAHTHTHTYEFFVDFRRRACISAFSAQKEGDLCS